MFFITERPVRGLYAYGRTVDDAQSSCSASAADGICAKVNRKRPELTLSCEPGVKTD